MCGITGFATTGPDLSAEALHRMNDAIAHRGPDDAGHFQERGVGLAMRRLSILDLEGSRQPLTNEDGSVVVVFNGEIYNFQALREELKGQGHSFRTQGDTEVLVHLYEEHGADMVHRLRGMFAFAIWDRRDRSLLLVRDRLGIKPLYYSMVGTTLVFGSELKCVLESKVAPSDLNWQAIDAFLAFTYIPAPQTIYEGISKLRPGHLLTYRDGRCEERQYWDVEVDPTAGPSGWEDAEKEVEKALQDAVSSHLVSDVPLGAFLSGGIDSSLLVAMMSDSLKEPVTTFTMGFDVESGVLRDERPYARLLGDRYEVEYNDFTVKPDFREILDDILTAFDEPFADDSVIPTYYISQLTRQKVKVALSGLGGDELFGGYHRYRGLLLSRLYDHVPRWLHSNLLDPVVQQIPEGSLGADRADHLKRFSHAATLEPAQRYLSYVSSLSAPARARLYTAETAGRIDPALTGAFITDPFERCPSDDILDRAFYTDLKTYLPDDILTLSDRLSMWHSLELRVPLIDHQLTELAMTLPSHLKVSANQTKILLKRVSEGWLPKEIIRHRKQGFESPMAAWLRTGLRDYAQEVLFDPSVRELGAFDHAVIRQLFDEHRAGRRRNNKVLFSLVMLFSWLKKNHV